MHIQKLTGSRRSGIGIQHQLTFHCDWSCCSPTPSATKKKRQQQEQEFSHLLLNPALQY